MAGSSGIPARLGGHLSTLPVNQHPPPAGALQRALQLQRAAAVCGVVQARWVSLRRFMQSHAWRAACTRGGGTSGCRRAQLGYSAGPPGRAALQPRAPYHFVCTPASCPASTRMAGGPRRSGWYSCCVAGRRAAAGRRRRRRRRRRLGLLLLLQGSVCCPGPDWGATPRILRGAACGCILPHCW